MGASTTYIVYGYELVEKEIEVSAVTYSEAIEMAQEAGLIKPYDAQQKGYEE